MTDRDILAAARSMARVYAGTETGSILSWCADELERLRGVLADYANEGHWDHDEYDRHERLLVWLVVEDDDPATFGGSAARAALEPPEEKP
jgi:hypothetical protein